MLSVAANASLHRASRWHHSEFTHSLGEGGLIILKHRTGDGGIDAVYHLDIPSKNSTSEKILKANEARCSSLTG